MKTIILSIPDHLQISWSSNSDFVLRDDSYYFIVHREWNSPHILDVNSMTLTSFFIKYVDWNLDVWQWKLRYWLVLDRFNKYLFYFCWLSYEGNILFILDSIDSKLDSLIKSRFIKNSFCIKSKSFSLTESNVPRIFSLSKCNVSRTYHTKS